MTNKKIHGIGRFSKLYLFKLCFCFCMLWVLGLPLHFLSQENSIQRIQNLATPLHFCSLHWGDFLEKFPRDFLGTKGESV